jgi:hypothetical protein
MKTKELTKESKTKIKKSYAKNGKSEMFFSFWQAFTPLSLHAFLECFYLKNYFLFFFYFFFIDLSPRNQKKKRQKKEGKNE